MLSLSTLGWLICLWKWLEKAPGFRELVKDCRQTRRRSAPSRVSASQHSACVSTSASPLTPPHVRFPSTIAQTRCIASFYCVPARRNGAASEQSAVRSARSSTEGATVWGTALKCGRGRKRRGGHWPRGYAMNEPRRVRTGETATLCTLQAARESGGKGAGAGGRLQRGSEFISFLPGRPLSRGPEGPALTGRFFAPALTHQRWAWRPGSEPF